MFWKPYLFVLFYLVAAIFAFFFLQLSTVFDRGLFTKLKLLGCACTAYANIPHRRLLVFISQQFRSSKYPVYESLRSPSGSG